MEDRKIKSEKINNVKQARVVQVIEVTGTLGDGTSKDPMGSAVQYWDFNGNLLGTLLGRPETGQRLEPVSQSELKLLLY